MVVQHKGFDIHPLGRYLSDLGQGCFAGIRAEAEKIVRQFDVKLLPVVICRGLSVGDNDYPVIAVTAFLAASNRSSQDMDHERSSSTTVVVKINCSRSRI
jgi:hypothetical protein